MSMYYGAARHHNFNAVLQIILRQWANDLECPIFCVDYSLAPEAPFPQAFDECFFAYAWALKNADLLGKKVIFY